MNPFGGEWIYKSRCWNEPCDPEMFFAEEPLMQQQAKDFCKGCPVALECIDYCNRMDIRGIAGGKSFIERKREESRQRKYLKGLQERMQGLLQDVMGPNAA